jgi:hypothetical protein
VGRQDCKSPYSGSILLPASRGYVGRKGWRGGSRPAEDRDAYAGGEGWLGGSRPAEDEDLALAGPLCYKARPY